VKIEIGNHLREWH